MHLQRFPQTNPKHLHRTQKGFLCPCHSDHLRHLEKGGTAARLTLVFENNIKRFLLVSFSPLPPRSFLSLLFIILHPIFIQDMIINICPGSRFIYTGAKGAGNFTHGRQHDLGSDGAWRFFFPSRAPRGFLSVTSEKHWGPGLMAFPISVIRIHFVLLPAVIRGGCSITSAGGSINERT